MLEKTRFSSIHSLTLAFVDKGVVRISYIMGEEGDILRFLNKLKANKIFHGSLMGVHSTYLGTRMDKNGIKTTIPPAYNTKGYVLGT
jgi:hypothetical protein